jgi:sterol desaturase/sphingolipid hydroxylase (fatty acid hydroxylase superfamily)
MVLTPYLPDWLEHTDIVRLHGFLVVFLVLAVMERLLPRRSHGWRGRAPGNIGLQLVNAGVVLLLALAAPLTLSAVALTAQSNQFGVFNHSELGLWTRIIIAWLVLDLATYWWHRAWHGAPLLWRFHRIHHVDDALDITTTFRTHPVETVATLLFRGALVLLMGPPLLGILLYELIVAAMALWIHANIRLQGALERVLGWFLVTPSLHRVHHGAESAEYNRNYGLVLSLWDRVFGTYRAPSPQPSGAGIGIPSEHDAAGLGNLLRMPFVRTA